MPDKSTGDIAADGYHKYKVNNKRKIFCSCFLELYVYAFTLGQIAPFSDLAIPKEIMYNYLSDISGGSQARI